MQQRLLVLAFHKEQANMACFHLLCLNLTPLSQAASLENFVSLNNG